MALVVGRLSFVLPRPCRAQMLPPSYAKMVFMLRVFNIPGSRGLFDQNEAGIKRNSDMLQELLFSAGQGRAEGPEMGGGWAER